MTGPLVTSPKIGVEPHTPSLNNVLQHHRIQIPTLLRKTSNTFSPGYLRIKKSTGFLFLCLSGEVQKTQTRRIRQTLLVVSVDSDVVTSSSVAGHVDAANVAGHQPDVAVAFLGARPPLRHLNDVVDTRNVVVAADVDVAQVRHDFVALPAASFAGRHLTLQPDQPQQDPPAFRHQHPEGRVDRISRCKF